VIIRSQDGRREAPSSAPTFELVLPLLVTIALLALLVMSSGYMLGAVTDEKENRTMEVLTTSVSTFQLIGGKIAGIVAISLTMLVSWILEILLGIWIAMQMDVAWFASPSIDWYGILSILAIAIPGYVLAAALMVALGAVMPSTQDAGSVSGIFFILHFAPMYVSWVLIQDPYGPAAVALSLLPFTALVSIGLRNLAASIPLWQIVVSAAVQIVCAAGAIWLASRIFRAGMLRYGQRLSLRGALRRGGRKA
jgi:ABC-2 type transport system permease protein